MEISAIEIRLLSQRISESVSGYFLSGIYSMDEGALFRFNHSTKPEKLVAVSSFAPWMTTKNLSLPQASKFISRLRDEIERFVLVSAEQVGNERITKFAFEGRKGEKRSIYAEFFSRGNLILTDPTTQDTIIDLANPQSFRHRTLAPGEKYALPPSRGIALQEIDRERLLSIFNQSIFANENHNLSAVKWFGRNIGTSRKFVEEIFKRANVDPETVARSLGEISLSALASACEDLRNELRQSESGNILIPAGDSELEIDVCQIIPYSWKTYSEKGIANIQSYASLNEALDEVQIQALVLDRKRRASLEIRAKAAEFASAITKQASQIERNRATAEKLRIMAAGLMREPEGVIGPEIIENLQSYGLLAALENSGYRLRFATEPQTFLQSLNSTSLASRLFDEAKRLEESNRRLDEVMHDLESQKAELIEQSRSQEEKAGRKIVTDRRERQWFERYRWFATSGGSLVVGGRD
ncbi:MAG: NFACT family protein, partial [Nitrososphaerales archaeon]